MDRMADLTPRARRILLALGGLYAVVNAFIGVHSGGDFRVPPPTGRAPACRVSRCTSTSMARLASPWPPFAIFALTPFALLARLSLPLTKALWAVGNVALFGWCLVRGYRHAGRWTPVVLAVTGRRPAAAEQLPAFEHQPRTARARSPRIADLDTGREMRAALWIGVATALKGYPGTIFLYFLMRGRWRPLVAGVTAAVGLTFLVVIPAGFGGAANVSDYVHLALTAQSTQALAGQSIADSWRAWVGTSSRPRSWMCSRSQEWRRCCGAAVRPVNRRTRSGRPRCSRSCSRRSTGSTITSSHSRVDGYFQPARTRARRAVWFGALAVAHC